MPFAFHFGGFDPGSFGGGFNPEDFQQQRSARSQRPRKARRAVGTPFTRTLINLAVTLVFALVYFYLELPALNFHAEEFYVFAFDSLFSGPAADCRRRPGGCLLLGGAAGRQLQQAPAHSERRLHRRGGGDLL